MPSTKYLILELEGTYGSRTKLANLFLSQTGCFVMWRGPVRIYLSLVDFRRVSRYCFVNSLHPKRFHRDYLPLFPAEDIIHSHPYSGLDFSSFRSDNMVEVVVVFESGRVQRVAERRERHQRSGTVVGCCCWCM
jgi:hypothetical protein